MARVIVAFCRCVGNVAILTSTTSRSRLQWRACESVAPSRPARREGSHFREASKNDGDSAINLNLEEPIHLSLCGRLTGREPCRNSRAFCSRGNRGIAKTSPSSERHARRCHKSKLADNKSHQPRKFLLHETIRMEPDAEHVHSEPGETRHNIAEDRHDHESALANKSAPACMQNAGAPEND